ncbi:hypothetical protein KQI84_05430 [bacterium]|nr:hypothetical protein [bacterium]
MSSDQELKARGRIGEILLECGMVSKEQLNEALDLAQRAGKRLGEALMELGTLDGDQLSWALGLQFDLSYVDLSPGMIDWELVRHFDLDRLRDLGLLPIAHTEGAIRAVIADPTIAQRTDEIKELFQGNPAILQLAASEDIFEMLDLAASEERESAAAPDDRTRIGNQMEKWISALATGELERLIIRPGYDESSTVVVSLSPPLPEYATNLSVVDVEAYAQRLSEFFSSNLHLPGGFSGLRPGKGTHRHRAIRAVSLAGVRGRLLALEALAVEFASREKAPILVFAGPSQRLAKAAVFRACERIAAERTDRLRGLLVSLEARIETTSPVFFQSEMPEARTRMAVCPQVVSAASPLLTVVEIEPGVRAQAFAETAQSMRLTPLGLVLHAETEEAARAKCPMAAQVLFIPPDMEKAMEVLAGRLDKFIVPNKPPEA